MDEASKHPITYRLPSKGTDPYFGLTRSFYYAAETQGRLTLIRLRSKGKSRGVTLVDFQEVRSLVEEARANPPHAKAAESSNNFTRHSAGLKNNKPGSEKTPL